MKTLRSIVAVVVILGIAGACSPNSKITASWKSKNLKKSYSNVMVAGLTSSNEAKRTIEDALELSLVDKGAQVIKSSDAFPANFTKEVTKEDILNKSRKQGADAILTVTVVDRQTESRYVPGTTNYSPLPMYNRFGGYYNYWYPTSYSPNYYTQDRIYYMETNLYDASSEELVWSAESETYNPSDLSGFSQELANLIALKLGKDGLIKARKVEPDKKVVSRADKVSSNKK